MVSLVPMVVGISQVLKNAGVPAKLIPLVNLVLGVGISLIFFADLGIKDSILQGLVAGLSAGGMYDQSRNLANAFGGGRDASDEGNEA